MIHRRNVLPYLALALVAACDTTTATGPRLDAADAAALSEQSPSDGQLCMDLIIEGTFHNVVVPAGATCTLVRSTLTGSLRALEGSSLNTSENQISGNVEIESAADVALFGDVIAGDVVIARSVGPDGATPFYRVAGVTLTHGNINVIGNSGISVALRDNDVLEGSVRVLTNVNTTFSLIANRVAHHVIVIGNTGPSGKMVRSTTAGGAVVCEANEDPFAAAENTARTLRGQCAAVPTPAE
jgi:hypothetical protein